MRSMANAIADAGLNPDDIDYLNAHATSTIAGDIAETVAIKAAFGDHAARLAVSATKSTTGHLLGAAGEGCDLDYVPNTARDATLNAVASNSFGFGGTNGTLVFKRVD